MSDNLGLNQTRVLDDDNRSFESVVYQRKKPPLSCEWNLTSDLASAHAQDVAKLAVPSGWAMVGNLKDGVTEADSFAGDVLCSSSYAANTFKLMALDKGVEAQTLVAWVNGWKLVIQGTNSVGDENNFITLLDPPSVASRVDFVFLEVWRYLLDTTDVVYKHGNVLYGGVNPANDLIDPAIGIETSLRIQTQYRIRVASTDIESYPSGFDPNQVFVQGPLDEPLSTCSHAYFAQVPGNPGLWRAGVGDSAAQEDLQTVDGYTYAIPMFAVARRNTGNFRTDDRSNGAGKSLADYLNGQPSDRPDNRYNDWIVADDILDMRSRVTTSDNMKELCETSFQKLTSGNLRGKLQKTYLGEDHFAKTLVQVDAVSNVDRDGSVRMAAGDNVRRMFSNAQIDQPDSIVVKTTLDKTVGSVGNNWAATDQFQIVLPTVPPVGYPAGSVITSVDDIYTNGTIVMSSSVTGLGTNTVTITVGPGSIVGQAYPITVDYTVSFAEGQNGFSMLPEEMLEFRSEDTTSQIIAATDNAIRVRQSDPVVATDGSHFNMLSNNSANITEPYNFGHQMTYHALGQGTNTVDFPRELFNYDILGVASIKTDASYISPTWVKRTATAYQINLGSVVATNADIEIDLYTGTKFFETNKQSRAVIDTYEMADLSPQEAANGSITSFTLDSTNRAIQALGSNQTLNGLGIAFVDGVQTSLTTSNAGLPTDTTKTRATVEFSSGPASGAAIEVPVLMKSAVGTSEGYDFFYHAVPYQGLLDATTTGVIEAVGPALTTTAGSGAITDTTYSVGTALFTQDSTTVTGTGTRWLSGVQAGNVISSDSSSENYTISEVYADDTIFLTAPATYASGNYTITALDQPFYRANIIDRLPIYDSTNDSAGRSENISTPVTDGFPVLETRIVSKVQDIVDSTAGSVLFGVGTADRGRSQVYIPGAPLGDGNLGLRFERLDSTGNYQKTYQSYILNKENSGHLYLMVVGSETGSDSNSRIFNEDYSLDTIDIFEMPGRPLTVRRAD